MKAITIPQPYASLVAIGAKRFLTMDRTTAYRGPVAIHAGKEPFHLTLWQGRPGAQEALVRAFGGWIDHERGGAQGLDDRYYEMPYGAVLATARLAECWRIQVDPKTHRIALYSEGNSRLRQSGISLLSQECVFGDYRSGRYAWELADAQPLPTPVPAKGRPGLWEWEGSA